MIKSMTLLGSTGSIGTQSLDVARQHGIRVKAISCRLDIKKAEEQIREFSPEYALVTDEEKAKLLKVAVSDCDTKILSGTENLDFLAGEVESDIVVNALVGMVGLLPTLSAIKAGRNIALANKETLVAGGELVMREAHENKVSILPVDSEHSAIFQCLQGMNKKSELKKLILTASGGPFFGKRREFLKSVTLADALKHPNWSMGAKITVDSATMMNKGLELIEAVWLFDVDPDDVDIVIHRESIVHSLIEYKDNSVIAQLGLPDMRIPIQYALTYPERFRSPVGELSLSKISSLSFFEPDFETFTPINAARNAISKGGTLPASVNAANEEAVRLFLKEKISFTDIMDTVCEVSETFAFAKNYSLDDLLCADREAREFVCRKFEVE